ncbi:uncharacterized protein LOC127241208 [Andrographis paniculata]|uniref:uncharacterized protein LOC127241208 n=1 Tax=Andrographis paniculata TaxID=175694 RepID=UPI0021E882B3|nr:uncharacterized protein LOC127241208 [Andrographis paniculata]
MGEKLVFMWGYIPGALSPVVVRPPNGGNPWKDVCGGGCGFAMAISDAYSGAVLFHFAEFSCNVRPALDSRLSIVVDRFWEAHYMGIQSYVTCGKHGLAGGEVYTWGWKECVCSFWKVTLTYKLKIISFAVSPRSHGSRSCGGSDEKSKRAEGSASGALSAFPCLVSLNPGITIAGG